MKPYWKLLIPLIRLLQKICCLSTLTVISQRFLRPFSMHMDLFVLFHCLLLATAVHLMPVMSIAPGKFWALHKQINEYTLHVFMKIMATYSPLNGEFLKILFSIGTPHCLFMFIKIISQADFLFLLQLSIPWRWGGWVVTSTQRCNGNS